MATIATTLRNYYRLAKPGIVYGNLLTVITAFLFAAHWHVAPWPFCGAAFGMGFVIASACVFNNILDRDIDAKMERTKGRQIVTSAVSVPAAAFYASFMLSFGASLLFRLGNPLTALIALAGFVCYVGIYTPLKRRTPWAAVIGAVPGAVPIVAGYTAVTGRLDLAALTLFLVLAFWQLPHFYAIAIRRAGDYAAAGIPTLPAVYGERATKRHMIAAIALYLIAAASLSFFRYAGLAYLGIVMAFGLCWLARALKGNNASDAAATQAWARGVFLFSLIVLCTFCIALAGASVLP